MSLLVGLLIGFVGYILIYSLVLAIKKKKSNKDNNTIDVEVDSTEE